MFASYVMGAGYDMFAVGFSDCDQQLVVYRTCFQPTAWPTAQQSIERKTGRSEIWQVGVFGRQTLGKTL